MGSCGSPRPDLILCTNRDHRASIIGLQPPIDIGTGFQLAPGRPAVVATLGRALLREDAGLHAYQMLEAGVRHSGSGATPGPPWRMLDPSCARSASVSGSNILRR
jgi:hypothetical protein